MNCGLTKAPQGQLERSPSPDPLLPLQRPRPVFSHGCNKPVAARFLTVSNLIGLFPECLLLTQSHMLRDAIKEQTFSKASMLCWAYGFPILILQDPPHLSGDEGHKHLGFLLLNQHLMNRQSVKL